MPKRWVDPLFLQEVAVGILLLAALGGIVGGWITLLEQFGVLE